MKRVPGILILFAVLLGVQWLIVPDESQAIPAFARRYNLSCSTCHAPIPKLKPYGADFAGDGFVIVENEKERDYVTAGDEMLWLNKTFPIGIRFDAYAVTNSEGDVKSDLQSPWGLKLMSGGALAKNIGYYFYFFMSERGEVAGIEDAYVHFNNIFGIPLDVLIGQFQTSDPLMKRELRLTYEDYMIYKRKVGHSNANLTYDRGIMLLYGLEQTSTDFAFTLTNGNGKGLANEESGAFDVDANKNIGVRLLQGITDKISIGGYYYFGEETMHDIGGERKNKVTYIGPDVNVTLGPVEITAQYLQRKDTNPWFAEAEAETETSGIVLEAVISPQLDRSRYYFTALYNSIDQEQGIGTLSTNSALYETATLGATYLVTRNLRLMAKFTRNLEMDANRMLVGLVSGF